MASTEKKAGSKTMRPQQMVTNTLHSFTRAVISRFRIDGNRHIDPCNTNKDPCEVYPLVDSSACSSRPEIFELAKFKMIQTSSYFEPENRKSLNEHPIRERNGVQDVGQPLPFPGEHRERFTDHAYFKF